MLMIVWTMANNRPFWMLFIFGKNVGIWLYTTRANHNPNTIPLTKWIDWPTKKLAGVAEVAAISCNRRRCEQQPVVVRERQRRKADADPVVAPDRRDLGRHERRERGARYRVVVDPVPVAVVRFENIFNVSCHE